MDFGSPDTNVRSTPRKTKDGPHFYPVSPGDSGEGLPYAPEDWPNPGDKWRWKAGKRVIGSGYFRDRFLYLPSRLAKNGQPKSFRSKYSVEQYVQSAFPGTDVNAFFASFIWNIPLKQTNLKVVGNESASSLVEAEVLRADSQLPHTCCKAGNNMCISLSVISDPPLPETMFCDICCSESGFCRNCCCILCSKTISSAFGNYGYIKCKAILVDGCICGHIAHIDCALQAHMVGSYDLDAEYFCRRCDSRTDLVSHIKELLKICESIDSRDEIEKILNSAISILHGSRKMDARQLLHHIESVMTKLKNGANFEDMRKKDEAVLEVITVHPSKLPELATSVAHAIKCIRVEAKIRSALCRGAKLVTNFAQPKVTKKKRTTHGKPRKDNAKGKRQKTTTEPNAPDTDSDFTIRRTSFLDWLGPNSFSTLAAKPKVTKKRRTTHGKPRKYYDPTLFPHLFDMQILTAWICAALNTMTIEGGSQTVVENEHIEGVDNDEEDEAELQQDIQLSFSSDSVCRNDEEDVVVHGNSNGEEVGVHGNSNDEEAVTVHGNSNHEEAVVVHGNSNDELQQLLCHENSNDEEEDVVHGKSNDEEAVVVHGNSVLSEELKRVKTWRSWRLMPIGELIQTIRKMTNENVDMMINEEHFALRLLNTNNISQALILKLKKTEKGKENRRLKTGVELPKEELMKKHTLEVDALEKKIEQMKAQLTALTTQVGNLNSTMSTNVVPTLNSLVVGQLEAFDLLKIIHDNLDDAKKGKSEAEKISER